MIENISSIRDPTVHIKPGQKLVQCLQQNSKIIEKGKRVPDNIKNIIKHKKSFLKKFDLEWLNEYLKNARNSTNNEYLSRQELDQEIGKIINKEYSSFDFSGYLREKNKGFDYLSDVMTKSEFVWPKNEVIKRNPVLAERVEKLKKEQEEKEYKEMTKNIDTSKKFIAEDTISYQMKMMNRHLIAVAQFLVSVAAGFAFGFLGVQLILGDLDFGFRLLLGISCALIIALAEFYFLAKHLNEEDKEVKQDGRPKPKAKIKGKLHKE